MIKVNKSLQFIAVILISFLLMLVALSCGIINISINEAVNSLWGIANKSSSTIIDDVVFYLRLPRFIMAISIGFGLATCGVVMQAIMKNPMADPYLLGISSGASLGAIIAIILGFTSIAGYDCIGAFAFLGAMLTTIGILLISIFCGRGNTLAVLLAGMGFNAICSALVSFIISVHADAEKIQSVTYWLMGSLLKNDWESIIFMGIVIAVICLFFMTRFRILNLMLLGDDVSVTLGRDLTNSKRIYIMLSAVMVGIIVYNAGMIGFVGLIIPHISRLLVGNNHAKLLPISGILGAVFLAISDCLSRVVISGSEVPIGVIVSLFGSPFFVYLLLSRKYGYGK